MADDIVTRLRNAADEHFDQDCRLENDREPHGAYGELCHAEVMGNAADEIERLRVAGERLYAICVLARAPFGHRAMLRHAMQKWQEARRG